MLFFALEIQNAPDVFGNLPALTISYVLLYVSIWMLYAMTGRVFVSGGLASLALLIFYTANFYRQMQTGQVLLPLDLNLARHIGGIFAFSNLSVHWRPVCSVLSVAVLNIPLYFVSKRIRSSIGKRAAILAVSGVFIYVSFFARFSRESALPSFIASVSANVSASVSASAPANASHNDIYREQGALLGFCSVFMAGDVDEPANYSREYMELLAAKVSEGATARQSPGNGDSRADLDNSASRDFENIANVANVANVAYPDVIIVMSESYWDPARLPNITYSEEVAPNLRALSNIATSGNVIPPVFGGMTCNTEFELLTGHSMKFTGNGDIPYYEKDTYIKQSGGRSLAAMFKANGYRTVALHTYKASFFDRDEIYPMLGFDAFIAEEDLVDALTKGSLRGQDIISDEYFCDTLIDIMANTQEPLFLFGITVQNHTPYPPDKYVTLRIQADSGGLLSDEDTEYLQTYIEGVYDADKVLGRLYDYVMASEKPTILLFFGDHLPILSQHTGIYTDLCYIGEGEMDDLPLHDAYKMHATPYVAFTNMADAELPRTWGEISPYFLGAVLADAAGIEMNLYYHFLLQAFGRFQAMNQYLYIANGSVQGAPRAYDMDMDTIMDNENDKDRDNARGDASGDVRDINMDINMDTYMQMHMDINIDNDIIEMFAALQYDNLFGEGYLDDVLSRFP
ncbi:MAG: LTA synthase family protein [Oscillospiraceae bacterium]|nr:LTA synthase family protein [Oscillospiraceae bacterium]